MLLALLTLLAGPTLAISLDTSVCFEPCSIVAHVTVVDYDVDRPLCLTVYDSGAETYVYRSCFPWGGSKFTDKLVRNLPAGEYDVVIAIEEGQFRPRAKARLQVAERFKGEL